MTSEAARRRATARAFHPDAGGSHDEFIAAMAQLEAAAATPAVIRRTWRGRLRDLRRWLTTRGRPTRQLR